MSIPEWVVHKFGGTSLADAERFRNAARILAEQPAGRKAVVVSAMAGVTDTLLEILALARDRDESYGARLREVAERHLETSLALLEGQARSRVGSAIESDARDIEDVLRAVSLSRTYSEQILDLVSGYGELWSAQLLEAHLHAHSPAVAWLDARKVLVVEHGETGPTVDWKTTRPRFLEWQKANRAETVVITGYVASTRDGIATTLKRNGSDFSASIFASLLGARSITIWTDVDGVMSADPRLVPEAIVLDEISYSEAVELAYFGASVVHPHTMGPAIEGRIPVFIRNSFNTSSPGTRIHQSKRAARSTSAAHVVKGLSCVDGVTVINLEGTGMIGVPGIAHRLFGALREIGVSVILISQASSEHSICFAVPNEQAAASKKAVERAFFAELHHGHIQTVELSPPCSILAAVGENMVESPGVAAKFFGALGKAGVNVRAIAQGSSELNISAVVNQSDSIRALRAVHSAFYLSNQTLSVGVVGPGLIGTAFLEQLRARADALRKQSRIDLRLRGILDSRRMLLDERGLDLASWKADLGKRGLPADLPVFTDHVQAEHLPHSVIVDCTASEAIAGHYLEWLRRGIHVVTPNKKANSGPLEAYRQLRAMGRKLSTHYLYEATVGAGLPVITTLRDLIETGDQVLQIEAVLSGSLSYIFNTFSESKPFSEAVREAQALCYTEPDPRDDLSGMDVARKVIILAREMGLALELADVQVQNLVPKPLQGAMTSAEFLDRVGECDEPMLALLLEAATKGQVLRYVGIVNAEGQALVELRRYETSHPFARLEKSDNLILFKTTRYCDQPLVVQGPGAGPQVTAGGIFADLLRLASYLGAPT
jgi:aspartokinase/homoserine dehydrogenase 1